MRKHLLAAVSFAASLAAASSLAPAVAGSWWVPKLREKEVAKSDAEKAASEAPTVPAQQPPAPDKNAAAGTAAVVAATSTALGRHPSGSLVKTCKHLAAGPLASEPNSLAYLHLIETGTATGAQVNDFANYLAKRGMPRVALQFQEYATELSPNDPTTWLNLGTIQRSIGELGSAAGSFKHAISIDATNGLAHYNLGSVYDADHKYDDAIEEYRRALILDPTLADPRKNPQVVNNENLLAVQLSIYSNKSSALGLPLLQMQPAAKPKPAAPAAATAAPPAAAPASTPPKTDAKK